MSRYNQVLFGEVSSSVPEKLEAEGEGVSLPITFPFDPDGDAAGEGDPLPGEDDPLSGEGVGESLVGGDVSAVGDGLGPGVGVGAGFGSGGGVGACRTRNTAGALVALTLWLLIN